MFVGMVEYGIDKQGRPWYLCVFNDALSVAKFVLRGW